MKKRFSLRPALLALFGLAAGLALPAQTMISGDTIASNLYVTNNVDMNGTAFTQGAVAISSTTDYRLKISDDASAVYFEQRKPTTNGDWLWQYNNGTTTVTTAKLDANSVLSLFNSGTAKVTLSPVSKSITLDTATLTGSGSALTAGGAFTTTGAFTASSGITNTNGALTGGASGLNLNAGSAGQNITLTTPSGSGDIVFNTNGLERARIKSTGGVGIGTATPSTNLSIGGGSLLSGGLGVSLARGVTTNFFEASDNTKDWIGGVDNTLGYAKEGTLSNHDLAIVTNNNPKIYVQAGGNVGVGTTNPTRLLSLNGTSNAYMGFKVGDVLQSTIGSDANGDFFVFDDQTSSYRMVIDTSGRIGVGTTAPATKLDVQGGWISTMDTGTSVRAFMEGGSSGISYFGNTGSGDVLIGNSNNWGYLTIKNGGNVGIGTQSPSAKFHVVAGSKQEIQTYIATSASGISDFAVGGVGWKFTRPGDGAFAHGIYTYDSSGGVKNNLAVSSRSDIVFTAGSSDPSGSPERMRISETGNVGVGTTNPGAKLEVKGSYGSTGSGGDLYANTENSVITLDAGSSRLGFVKQYGDYPAIAAGSASPLRLGHWNTPNLLGNVSSGTFTPNLVIDTAGNVGIGTTNTSSYKLAVLGSIHATSVVVETGWSDYVFDKDYRLAPLSEVEAHIKAEKHLPGIPSAAEVAEKGVSLGDMQSKLLAKVEELTLHLIEQEKRIARLEQENRQLKGQSINP